MLEFIKEPVFPVLIVMILSLTVIVYTTFRKRSK
jgi:hypothetical protein